MPTPDTSPRRTAPWGTPFAVFLACLLALAAFVGSEWTYQRALESLSNLGGRDSARAALQTVMRRTLDLETAQRGFLLTGRDQYLEPYRSARTDLDNAFNRLREHYRNDAELTALVADLQEKVLQKVSEVDESIRLYAAGSHPVWQGLLLTDIGREKMDSVRRVAEVLLNNEDRRVARERADIYRTLAIGRLSVHALTLLSLLAYVFYLRKNAALHSSQAAHARQLKAERDSLDAQVRQRTEELALLNLGLQELREGERGGLARALHDELGALLTAAKLDLTRLRHNLALPGNDVGARLAHLNSVLDQSIDTKRRLMEGLMPSALQNLGLQAALEQRAGELQQRTQAAVELDLQALLELPGSARQALYAVAQGALSNIEQHAAANRVALRLAEENGELVLTVADNGRGFAVSEAGSALAGASASAQSLRNMRYRIESLGGRFDLRSAPGDGTRIEARLPVRGLPPRPPPTQNSEALLP